MKNLILGFISALVLVTILYFGYPIIRGFFDSGPMAPELLNPAVKDFGKLRVEVFGKGKPLTGLEVDLGDPGGRMSYAITDAGGAAVFEKVSVGTFSIFFNDLNYPKEFERVPSPVSVQILKDQTIQKRIELTPKQ